jgi:hypothetical protein
MKHFFCAALVLLSAGAAVAETARGFVFHDANGNGTRDEGEAGIAGVAVSNGEDVVRTGEDGAYQLTVDNDTILFITKPSGWRTAYDHNGTVARFYYIHKPEGSPKLKYPGVAPTGPLPESVDFALTPQEEENAFRMIVMGDPQPRDIAEVDLLSHDVYEELVTLRDDVKLGASLGDLVFNGLEIYPDVIAQASLIGVPWFHVIGNHDLNFDVEEPRQSTNTYEYWLGPSWYSADYANVHFVILNSIWWDPKEKKYEGRFGDDQIAWLKNDLALVPKDRLVVAMMHIPLWECVDHPAVVKAMAPFENKLSLSAHTHVQGYRFLPEGDGGEHLHLNMRTGGGSWLRGAFDEVGLPHATMRDGGPNGYAIMHVEGNNFSLEWKAARREPTYQMDVTAPDEVKSADAAGTEVVVNYFSGTSKSKVEFRLDREGEWLPMEQFTGVAPEYRKIYERHLGLFRKIAEFAGKNPDDEEVIKAVSRDFAPFAGAAPPKPGETQHLWKAALPANPAPGYHVIWVRATDQWGKQHSAQRIIRVVE